jgi:hypothetical protein
MDLSLNQQLQEKKQSILAKWQHYVLNSDESHQMLIADKNKGRFSNPAAYVSGKNTDKIFDCLINVDENMDIITPLHDICRLRAVQDVKPSQALQFIPMLKQIIRDELSESQKSKFEKEIWDLEKHIDKISLLAFDIYVECKNKINEIRIDEIKRLYGRDER